MREDIEAVFHTSKTGVEVFLLKDGTLSHSKLTPVERKEIKIKVRAHKMLKRIATSQQEYRELMSIPYTVGVNFVEMWEDIFAKKMKKDEVKAYLLELLRFYNLTWRG
jgi:hypothetical protein